MGYQKIDFLLIPTIYFFLLAVVLNAPFMEHFFYQEIHSAYAGTEWINESKIGVNQLLCNFIWYNDNCRRKIRLPDYSIFIL